MRTRRVGCMATALICLATARAFGGDNVWTGSGPLGGERVNGIAVDPFDPATAYVATRGIFKSSDGGRSWQSLADYWVEAVAIHPAASATLYAAQCGSSGIVKSTDGGLTWAAAGSGLANRCVTSLAIDPLNPSTIYAGTNEGVFRSTDGGASWRSIRSGMDFLLNVLALAIDPVSPSTIYAGALLEGVFKSTNRGDRWNAASSGLPTIPNPFVPSVLHPPTIEALAVDPVSPSTLYAGASLPAGLFRSTNGAASWTTITPPAGGASVYTLVLDPSASGTVYAGFLSFSGSGVWRSQDGGASWSSFSHGLSESSVTALAIDRSGTHLYAGTFPGEVFAYRIATPRLRILLPDARVPPRVVSPRP
jgi:hypothetical protein